MLTTCVLLSLSFLEGGRARRCVYDQAVSLNENRAHRRTLSGETQPRAWVRIVGIKACHLTRK